MREWIVSLCLENYGDSNGTSFTDILGPTEEFGDAFRQWLTFACDLALSKLGCRNSLFWKRELWGL